MEVAIIGGAVTLTAALIAAFVALRAKSIDLRGQGKQRRAEDLRKGYNQALAAMDTTWHFHCHAELSNLGWKPPFDWDTKWPPVRDEVQSVLSSAIDLLKANSHNYHNVSAALSWALRVIWDGYTLKMEASTPDDYAEVREMINYCSRLDDDLEKPITKRSWRKLRKINQPRPARSGEEQLSRMHAMLREASARGDKDVTFISQDQDFMLAYLKSFETRPPVFVSSLALSWRRMKSWSESDFIASEVIPCLTLDPPCHVTANDKLREQ
ncbi:hypothetical protein [Amycolatopsis kentuckyensis]|uniref:hypothetical protein n=1 Tax=Amycolatopsis kentuckyensis TaxID=218823 RepID=UPI0035669F09